MKFIEFVKEKVNKFERILNKSILFFCEKKQTLSILFVLTIFFEVEICRYFHTVSAITFILYSKSGNNSTAGTAMQLLQSAATPRVLALVRGLMEFNKENCQNELLN